MNELLDALKGEHDYTILNIKYNNEPPNKLTNSMVTDRTHIIHFCGVDNIGAAQDELSPGLTLIFQTFVEAMHSENHYTCVIMVGRNLDKMATAVAKLVDSVVLIQLQAIPQQALSELGVQDIPQQALRDAMKSFYLNLAKNRSLKIAFGMAKIELLTKSGLINKKIPDELTKKIMDLLPGNTDPGKITFLKLVTSQPQPSMEDLVKSLTKMLSVAKLDKTSNANPGG